MTAIWTALTKNISSWTAGTKTGPPARSGQVIGLLLALTYSGGQFVTGDLTWTALNKS